MRLSHREKNPHALQEDEQPRAWKRKEGLHFNFHLWKLQWSLHNMLEKTEHLR